VQITAIAYILLATPFLGMWCFGIDDVMIWMGMGEEVARIPLEYTRIVVFHNLIDGFTEGVDSLLDLTGHEWYGTGRGSC